MVTTGSIGKIYIKFIKLNNEPPKLCEFIQLQPDKTEDRSSTQEINIRKAE